MSPPGGAVTSQGRHVIKCGLEYQRSSTAVQNDLRPLPLCGGTAAQNIALTASGSGTSLPHSAATRRRKSSADGFIYKYMDQFID